MTTAVNRTGILEAPVLVFHFLHGSELSWRTLHVAGGKVAATVSVTTKVLVAVHTLPWGGAAL